MRSVFQGRAGQGREGCFFERAQLAIVQDQGGKEQGVPFPLGASLILTEDQTQSQVMSGAMEVRLVMTQWPLLPLPKIFVVIYLRGQNVQQLRGLCTLLALLEQ